MLLKALDFDRPLKHEALRDAIRQAIMSGELAPGDILPSQNEMSKMYGVSHHTVREAVASLVSEGLLSRSQGKGTLVEQPKIRRPVIGLMLPHWGFSLKDGQPFGYDVQWAYLNYVEDEIRRQKSVLMLCLDQDDSEIERENLKMLTNQNVDGIIAYYIGQESNYEQLKRTMDNGIPIVLIDRYVGDIDCDFVVTDNRSGAYDLVEKLIEQGCEQVCFVSRAPNQSTSNIDRLSGYKDALAAHGLSYDPRLVIDRPSMKPGEFEETFMSRFKNILFTQPKCGVFAGSLMDMVYIFNEFSESDFSSIIAKPIHLACFDQGVLDIPVEYTLAYAEQPLEEISRQSVKLIMKKLSGDTKLHQIKLKPTIKMLSS